MHSCAKFALDLISRGRLIPAIESYGEQTEARWRASIALPDDADRFARLANSFPPAAHAIAAQSERAKRSRRKPQEPVREHVWTPDALLERFLNASADLLIDQLRHEGYNLHG